MNYLIEEKLNFPFEIGLRNLRVYIGDIPNESLVTAASTYVFNGDNIILTDGAGDGRHGFEIPGGHKEENESSYDSAYRELYEETGIKCDYLKQFGYVEIVNPEIINPNNGYPYPVSYIALYVGLLDNMPTPNQHGSWLKLKDARNCIFVKSFIKTLEVANQHVLYMKGVFKQQFLKTYNDNGEDSKISMPYEVVHVNGAWHKGIHVFAMNEFGEFLIQKRSMNVQTKPGLYENTAGGHVENDDTPIQTAIIEMEEEAGIKLEEKDFLFVGTITDVFKVEERGIYNRELDYIYIAKIKKSDFTEHDNNLEIGEYIWVDAKDYITRAINGDPTIATRMNEYLLLKDYLGF